MVTNYYNASNQFRAPIRKEPKPFQPEQTESTPKSAEKQVVQHQKAGYGIVPIDRPTDTLLLLGVVLLLMTCGCNDTLLLIALCYLAIT